MQLTWRSGIGGVVGIVGALAVSCQGSSGNGCLAGPSSSASGPPPVLLTRYVLVNVQPFGSAMGAVPGVYDDSAGFKLRVDADTLFFNTDSTYREVGQTALVPTSGAATVRPQATGTPAPRYSSGYPGSLTLPKFMGRKGTVSYYGQQLTVMTDAGAVQNGGPFFYFQAR